MSDDRTLDRKSVWRSGRVRVTEALIRECDARAVLEVGAGDHSFRPEAGGGSSWIRLDFAPPCDVLYNVNDDRTHLPFREGSFDLVVCTEVIEHLLWPQHLVAETFRVLRPGGAIVVSVPNIVSASYRVAWLLGHLPSCAASANIPTELGSTAYRTNDGRYVGGHVVDFTRRRLELLLRQAGFEVRRMKGSGIIWRWQVLPPWAVPASLASNLICLARRPLSAPPARCATA